MSKFAKLRTKTASQDRRTGAKQRQLIRWDTLKSSVKLGLLLLAVFALFLPSIIALAAPPDSPGGLSALPDGNNVILSWAKDPEAQATVVVRGESCYPSDIYDGVIVYDDEGESCIDEGIYSPLKNIYYRAWSYTQHEGYSESFAQVAILIPEEDEAPMEIQMPMLTELFMVLGLTAFALWRREMWVYMPAVIALVLFGMRWAATDLMFGIPFFALAIFMAARLGWVFFQRARE